MPTLKGCNVSVESAESCNDVNGNEELKHISSMITSSGQYCRKETRVGRVSFCLFVFISLDLVVHMYSFQFSDGLWLAISLSAVDRLASLLDLLEYCFV